MKWITREKPKIDRIACPWLIRRFVDPEAEIIFVPFDQVLKGAEELHAIPFDLPGVEYTHYDDKCTFDYIMQKHALKDEALDRSTMNNTGKFRQPASPAGSPAFPANMQYSCLPAHASGVTRKTPLCK